MVVLLAPLAEDLPIPPGSVAPVTQNHGVLRGELHVLRLSHLLVLSIERIDLRSMRLVEDEPDPLLEILPLHPVPELLDGLGVKCLELLRMCALGEILAVEPVRYLPVSWQPELRGIPVMWRQVFLPGLILPVNVGVASLGATPLTGLSLDEGPAPLLPLFLISGTHRIIILENNMEMRTRVSRSAVIIFFLISLRSSILVLSVGSLGVGKYSFFSIPILWRFAE